ncbi:uncharacterized protein LOC113013730 [Astatotilapia calliptera]|uniref:uncharacterized protein LOC113013730 n=1 Tax=Astatotilapia calliptera TaxID=8154 RepID=UPI000E3FEF13|nr:uncharacterized protein LOC113013730 [Astatotilapia calliptera]
MRAQSSSKLATPLTTLTSTKRPFLWTPEAEAAFERFKDLFTSAPVLQHPDPNKSFVLEVDTSDIAVGAILSQRTGPRAKLKHCAFFSRRLSPAERNYCVGDRELLAIKLALEECRHLLEGAEHPFVIFTDHKNLIYLRTAKLLNARQARWSLFFDRFNFSLSFHPGHKNAKADALSRKFAPDTDQTVHASVLPAACQVAFLALQDEPDPGTRPPGRWFIPSAARAPVITWACDSRFSCHPGTARTTAVIKRHFCYSGKFHHTEQLIFEIWLTRLLSESSPCLTCLPSCPYTITGSSPLRTAATHHQTHRTAPPLLQRFHLPPAHTYLITSQLPLLSWTCPLALSLSPVQDPHAPRVKPEVKCHRKHHSCAS